MKHGCDHLVALIASNVGSGNTEDYSTDLKPSPFVQPRLLQSGSRYLAYGRQFYRAIVCGIGSVQLSGDCLQHTGQVFAGWLLATARKITDGALVRKLLVFIFGG